MTLSTTPRATARLQFHKDFTLDDAAALVPYFAALGVSHLYASPLFKAMPGSTHGYDVIDPTIINPELGGLAALKRLVAELRAHEMGLLLDVVSNHMGVGGAGNAWWQDVLEFGPLSRYAGFFDIDWAPPDPALQGKLLAPFLGSTYGDALDSGEIVLRLDDEAGFCFDNHGNIFPLSPRSVALVLRRVAPRLSRRFAEIAALPEPAEEAARAKAELRAFMAGNRVALDEAITDFSTPERLHQLLQRQYYRLAWWRTAAAEINWRRFFDINTLAGLRVERPEVFDATHGLLLRLYGEGLIDGVRIDHVDGLADPGAYLRKLRRVMERVGANRPEAAAQGAPYIVVEKILGTDETLEPRWRVDGTTGYDFMDQASAVLHDPDGEAPLSALWQRLTGRGADFDTLEEQVRRQILRDNLAGELDRLAAQLHRVARRDAHTSDFSLHVIRQGLEEILASFPVYRIYAGPAGHGAEDARMFGIAAAAAAARMRKADKPVLGLLRRWLLEDRPFRLPPGPARDEFMRARIGFQQLSAPTAAKSVEDTCFYRFGRLLSRNDVGSNPAQFSLSPAAFHALAAARGAAFPGALLATATHDHKRGEDTRARLAVLSEIPGEWEAAVLRWMRLNNVIREDAGPDAADELMLYQMLVAGWPLTLDAGNLAGIDAYARRVAAWQKKSLREAKLHSEWAAPDEAYEGACERFITGCLDARREMLYEIIAFANRIAAAGAINGLAQTLLRLTVPGVPDLYQGTEFWDQSFVDPDNRRLVDFTAREAALRESDASLVNWRNGAIKQAVIARALAARRQQPDLFARGAYEALVVEGAMARHALTLRRHHGEDEIVAVATRLVGGFMIQAPLLPPFAWGMTSIPLKPGKWRELLSGVEIESDGNILLADLLVQLPVALLRRTFGS
ncbi:MAG: malto-oligosyltrehalose synthase [Rhodospirillales bacterium]|nr:malto-oligosyltrehalose synthase [Rhodospirillales bacterium]